MKKLTGGVVHKTYLGKYKGEEVVIQYINPKFKVPSRNKVNNLVKMLKSKNIISANIIYQDKEKRIFEKLNGIFYDNFTTKQAIKALHFMVELQGVLGENEIKCFNQFYLVDDFSGKHKKDIVWGDLKANNILWQKGKPVGIIDYDTISKGKMMFDICTAIATWEKTTTMKFINEVITEYCISKKFLLDSLDRFILVRYKQLVNEMGGLGYFKKQNIKTYQSKIKKLNLLYEKSINWRDV